MYYKPETEKNIAESLLQIKAIKLQPNQAFTWASGWKSPIYCDNRLTLSHPSIRTYIRQELTELITEVFGKIDLIAGVATAGIPQGVLVAHELGLPFAYVRPEPKKHGMGNQIEGDIKAGQKVVLIEDLVSTGKSSLQAVDALRQAGAKVAGLVCIFSYGFDIATEAFKNAKCPYYSLSNYNTLINEALNGGYITEDDLHKLKLWRETPDSWQP